MNIEEAKKIIQNKIQADEAAREVRKNIKSYIHQKQNAREGFTETFKQLIETSEKVKESIDKQQNKLIKQLQENQLALTQGFEGNRLALTSALDKMDLEKLEGYEKIEDEEEKIEDEEEKIKNLEKLIEEKSSSIDFYYKMAAETEEEGKEAMSDIFMHKAKIEYENLKKMKEDLEKMKTNLMEKKEKEIKKEPVTITDKKNRRTIK